MESAALALVSSGDWDRLVPLILEHAKSFLSQGRTKTLDDWLGSIPMHITESIPWILYWKGVCRLSHSPAESRAFFEKAFNLFEKHKDDTGTFLAWSGAVNAIFVGWNDFAPFDSFIAWFYERAHSLPFPSIDVEAEFASSMACAMIWRQPFHPDIRKWVERALEYTRKSGNPRLRFQAYNHASAYYLWTGDNANALLIYKELKEMTHAQHVPPLVLIRCKCLEAITCYSVFASYETGLHAVSEAFVTARDYGIHVWDHMIYQLGVYGSLLKGDEKAASEYLDKMKSTLRPDRSHGLCQYHYVAAWNDIYFGNLPGAVSHAQLALRLAEQIRGSSLYFPEIRCRLALANILCEKKDYEEANRQLTVAHDLANRTGSDILEFMYRMTKARVDLEQGIDSSGLEMLRRAMVLGREHDFMSMQWWWQPSVMSKLCAKALSEGIETEYVQNLIRKSNFSRQIMIIG